MVGATYANGWLIIVGASKTSPVPGSGTRRYLGRLRILPRFGALRGDNTPSPALRGLRMITRSERVATNAPRAVGFKGEEEQGKLLLPSLYGVCVTLRSQPFAWMPRGVYIGLPPGGTMVIRLGSGPSRQCVRSPASPPAPGSRRLVGPAGCRLLGRQAGPTA